jgi:hypothetical protein
VALDVLDVVEFGGQRVVDVDDHDLPVGLALVEQCHDTENLDLDDLTRLRDELANLADIERVVVALGLGLLMDNIGVLPCLQPSVLGCGRCRACVIASYLREGSVVPEVALVGEAVPHEAQLALLDVLFDGVERLLFGDLVLSAIEPAAMRQLGPRTSIFALVQRGTSTTMLRIVCCSLAYSGMSCHGETSWPSFSM